MVKAVFNSFTTLAIALSFVIFPANVANDYTSASTVELPVHVVVASGGVL